MPSKRKERSIACTVTPPRPSTGGIMPCPTADALSVFPLPFFPVPSTGLQPSAASSTLSPGKFHLSKRPAALFPDSGYRPTISEV